MYNKKQNIIILFTINIFANTHNCYYEVQCCRPRQQPRSAFRRRRRRRTTDRSNLQIQRRSDGRASVARLRRRRSRPKSTFPSRLTLAERWVRIINHQNKTGKIYYKSYNKSIYNMVLLSIAGTRSVQNERKTNLIITDVDRMRIANTGVPSDGHAYRRTRVYFSIQYNTYRDGPVWRLLVDD